MWGISLKIAQKSKRNRADSFSGEAVGFAYVTILFDFMWIAENPCATISD